MRILVAFLVISTLVLPGCSRLRDSAFNPGNWFGGARTAAPADASATNPLIPRETRLRLRRAPAPYAGTPVDRITGVTVEPTTAGAIVKVTGVTLQQGSHDVRLTSESDGKPVDGVLSLRLLAVQPANQPQGQPRQRTVHAGRFLSDRDLAATRTIRVEGARNAMVSGR